MAVAIISSEKLNPVEIRQQYRDTLEKMKNAHLTAFFRMKENVNPSSQGIPLTRAFSSFNPCPLRLTIVELCRSPLDVDQLPEIFSSFKKEFVTLYRSYQKLGAETKEQISEELIEGSFSDEIAFSRLLDGFVLQIIQGRDGPKISLLKDVCQSDFKEANELINFLARAYRSEIQQNPPRAQLSITRLLRGNFYLYITTGEWSDQIPAIYENLRSKLDEIKMKYEGLKPIYKFAMELELKIGGLGFYPYNELSKEVVAEFGGLISEIKQRNIDLLPSIISLAYLKAGISNTSTFRTYM